MGPTLQFRFAVLSIRLQDGVSECTINNKPISYAYSGTYIVYLFYLTNTVTCTTLKRIKIMYELPYYYYYFQLTHCSLQGLLCDLG
jgi:hypothetical protein